MTRTAEDYPRLDRAAPRLSLTAANGERAISDFRGRPVLVTFAFGHCADICPLVVHNVNRFQEAAGGERPAVLVVSLDPWRDTPSGLAPISAQWSLSPDASLLSGSVGEVEETLDAWSVDRRRDPRTGDIIHPPLVYLVDGDGRIAFTARGGTEELLTLLSRI